MRTLHPRGAAVTGPAVHFADAVFSSDRRYRYMLWRHWGEQTSPFLLTCFILLNPSTADATTDDATVRRCIAFSRSWGDAGMNVMNLFGLRATDPRELYVVDDPVGPANDAWLHQAGGANRIVVAWGNHGALNRRDAEVLAMLPQARTYRFGLTAEGQPRHPLYLRRDASLELAL